MLRTFVKELHETVDSNIKTRIFVDDGPMNDRAAAERSGVGWFGKNTNILTSKHGSWVFLAQVITNLNLQIEILTSFRNILQISIWSLQMMQEKTTKNSKR